MKIQIFAISLLFLSFPAFAENEKRLENESSKGSPLEITADTALEWNQADKTYLARGKAVATQGKLSVKADTLTATYAGVNGNTSDIHLLTADGHVTLTSGPDVATGDKVVYNLTTGQGVLSGTKIRPKVIQDGKNTLEADRVTVWIKDSLLDHAEADGNVVITSGDQKATGQKATYHARNNTAELIGQVKVIQGPNLIEGDKAEINLSTRTSRMISSEKSKRVKAVFFQNKQAKD